MVNEVALVAGVGIVSIAIRLAPELWLRGREPPAALADALAWLPPLIAGTMLGALHMGASSELRPGYVLAGLAGGSTLLWRRSFYLPLLVGAATLAIVRALELA